MKNALTGIALFLCLGSQTAYSQGVKLSENGGSPDESAIFEIESTSKGMLPPRMTTSQRDQIINPAEGLLIFNSDTKCLNMWMGNAWKKSCFDCDFTAPLPQNNSPVCAGSDLLLSAGNLPGATYLWVGPNGFTSSLQNPIVSQAGGESSGSYMLSVTFEGCTAQPVNTIVTVYPIPEPPLVNSNSPVCESASLQLSAAPTPGVSFQWSGPQNFSATGNASEISNMELNRAGTYQAIAIQNGCASPPTEFEIEVATVPGQPSAIIGDSEVCPETAGFEYEVENVDGVSYSWSVPSGWTVQSGQGSPETVIASGSVGGLIQVTPSNFCGSGDPRTLNVSIREDLASGGTITGIPGYKVHTFTESGIFEVECALTEVEVLVVAGGGGGGRGWEGGGGGAGGVLYNASYFVNTGQQIQVTVGAGGTGGLDPTNATNGQNSVFGSFVAIGGGAGGSLYGGPGSSGGSGGGAAWNMSPGSGTSGQGFPGGTSTAGQYIGAGGGGGAGGPGQNLTGPSSGAAGGIGLLSSITGIPTYFGGGGGGSAYQSYNPPGGLGGGGNGSYEAPSASVPTNGQPNTGGGGGASRVISIAGGNGGSGIVIVRYPVGI